MLAELAEINMDVAREVCRQALDPATPAPAAAALALTFSRIAREVGQILAPEARLAQDNQKDRAERGLQSDLKARLGDGDEKADWAIEKTRPPETSH
jgi:hypothetical protein